MIPETALCIAIWLPTAWGLAPEDSCVLDCDVTSIYRHAIPARLLITGPFEPTCDRTVGGNTKDAWGNFPVVRMDDGTWHWLREQDPVMCGEEANPK